MENRESKRRERLSFDSILDSRFSILWVQASSAKRWGLNE